MLLLALQELAEDAPQRPDVHRAGVPAVAHDHLRRAVARRRDDGREHVPPREGRRARHRALTVALTVRVLRRRERRERRFESVVAETPARRPAVSFPATRLSRGVAREIRLRVRVVHGHSRVVVARVPPTTSLRRLGAAREAEVADFHHATSDSRLTAQRVRALYVPVPDA